MTTDPTPIRPDPDVPAPPQYVYPPARPTSGLAITALVLGLVGGAILAVIFGHVALNDIRKTGKDGKGMAVAGLVLGYIETAFWILIVVLFTVAAAAGSGY
jgi:peptidyl-prolyl cis-trans isomerase B (cyclophilin B)